MENCNSTREVVKLYIPLYNKAKQYFDKYLEYYGGLSKELDRVYAIGSGNTEVFVIAGVHVYEGKSTFPAITKSFDLLANKYGHLLEVNKFNFILTKPDEDPQTFLENQIDEKNPSYVIDLHCASKIYRGFYIEGTVSNNVKKTIETATAMLEEVKSRGFNIMDIKCPGIKYPIQIKSNVKGLALGGVHENCKWGELFELEADALVYSALKGIVSLTLESYEDLPEPHIAAIEGFYKYLSK